MYLYMAFNSLSQIAYSFLPQSKSRKEKEKERREGGGRERGRTEERTRYNVYTENMTCPRGQIVSNQKMKILILTKNKTTPAPVLPLYIWKLLQFILYGEYLLFSLVSFTNCFVKSVFEESGF